jgi:hypothetical protein
LHVLETSGHCSWRNASRAIDGFDKHQVFEHIRRKLTSHLCKLKYAARKTLREMWVGIEKSLVGK